MTAEASIATPTGVSRQLSPRPYRPDWRFRFARRVLFTDLLTLVWVVFGTQILWFGAGAADVAIREDARLNTVSYWVFSSALVVAWLWTLTLNDSRSDRVIGTGVTEYVRIINSSVQLFGVIAILAFLFRVDLARGYLLISLPAGVFFLLLTRWMWRQWLVSERAVGRYAARVVLAGSPVSVALIARDLVRTPSAGYVVIGACVSGGVRGQSIGDLSVLGSLDEITEALAAAQADTLAITSTGDLPPNRLKEISWSLEAGRQYLVLAPSLIDIAGPRIHSRPVAGLPLVHVETPRFSRGQLFVKRTLDLAVAGVGVIVISPLLLVLALLVRASGPGPVIFRQPRVGYHGREFTMLKFRSMVADAEDRLADLKAQQRDMGNEVLFKMKNDPRVTRVGRFMRRYSLDELPQLFNVIGGSMSLVGPRPPLDREVALYERHAHRRFLTKPGITGLWQVSGRSALSWEESLRLDLDYVENWTLLGDILILGKTAKAALAPGATAA